MPTPLDRDVRDHLRDYLRGQISVDQFQDWLVAAIWDIGEREDSPAVALIYEIQLALADHSSGLTTASEMREALSDLAHVAR